MPNDDYFGLSDAVDDSATGADQATADDAPTTADTPAEPEWRQHFDEFSGSVRSELSQLSSQFGELMQHVRGGQAQQQQQQQQQGFQNWNQFGEHVLREQNELKQQLAARVDSDVRREAKTARDAYERLRDQFEDIEKYVPPSVLDRAVGMIARDKAFGQDWEGDISTLYWKRKGPEMYRQQKATPSEDDLARKRGTTVGAPQLVPPGGAGYQRPEPQEAPQRRDPGYGKTDRAFAAELKRLGMK
jgi:hypothetical protein